MKNTLSVRGTREGLTITLGEGELAALLDDLSQHLATQGAFFRGGTVALYVSDRAMQEGDITQISELLAQHEMVLRTVASTSTTTQEAAKALGLRLLSEPAPTSEVKPIVTPPPAAPHTLEGSKGLLIRHLVRSGQIIRHTGHVVIIGDVNAGAEIIAGGDVVIWGRLYGMVHAGAMGNSQAVVCALELTPLQLRIGDLVARSAEEDRPKKPYPEIAHVRDNSIVVDPWDRASRGV
jgi:septum site-determining protein MinC